MMNHNYHSALLSKNLVGIQRQIYGFFGNPKSVKYITVMINDDAPKIYGLDNIRTDAPVYVTEGPFDSTFVRNAIAMQVLMLMSVVGGLAILCMFYDNEPRNREITNRIAKTIDSGDKVVIWTKRGIDDKDINDMVMSGLDVQSVIQSNTYSGLEAKLKFNTWKKNMSNGTKVKKRDGRIESLDLDKIHLMVDEPSVKVLREYQRVRLK